MLSERVHSGQEGGVGHKLVVMNAQEKEETATAQLNLPAMLKPQVKKLEQLSHLCKWHRK